MEAGHSVTVVTCRNHKSFRQDPGLSIKVDKMIRVPAWDWRTLRLLWSAGDSPVVRQGIKESFWGRWLTKAQDSFPLSLLLGDGGLIYILNAYVQACRLIRRYQIAYLITSYRPFVDHWIGFLLKMRFPNLYWIADFRDLHIDPPRGNVLWPRWQHSVDQLVVQKADMVTTVSEGLAAHLPGLPHRIHILRNAIPLSLLERRAKITEKFTITYTGAIYPGLQEAGLLFQALNNLLSENKLESKKLQLLYLGKEGEVWENWMKQYNLQDYSSNRGERPRKEVLSRQSESTLNLLLSWSSEQVTGILTSKIYEYLSSGVATLALINGPRDPELETLIEGTGSGRVFYHQSEQLPVLQQFLWNAYREWELKGLLSLQTDNLKIQEYTWPVQVAKLWERLKTERENHCS